MGSICRSRAVTFDALSIFTGADGVTLEIPSPSVFGTLWGAVL